MPLTELVISLRSGSFTLVWVASWFLFPCVPAVPSQRSWHLLQSCWREPPAADGRLWHEDQVLVPPQHAACSCSPAETGPVVQEPAPQLRRSLTGNRCRLSKHTAAVTRNGSVVLFRFWDLAYPERSYIVAGGANDSLHCPSVLYSRKIIEGTEVVQVSSPFSQQGAPHAAGSIFKSL